MCACVPCPPQSTVLHIPPNTTIMHHHSSYQKAECRNPSATTANKRFTLRGGRVHHSPLSSDHTPGNSSTSGRVGSQSLRPNGTLGDPSLVSGEGGIGWEACVHWPDRRRDQRESSQWSGTCLGSGRIRRRGITRCMLRHLICTRFSLSTPET